MGLLSITLAGSLITTSTVTIETPDFGELAKLQFGSIVAGPQDEAEQPVDLVPVRSPTRFGEEGTWRFQIQVAYGVEVHTSDNEFFLGGIGFSYFLADNFSVDFEFNGLKVDQVGEDGYGGNFNLLFRWHFHAQPSWSMYLDGGAGMLYSSQDVPASGSQFNFTPQAGLGFTFDVGDANRLMIGARWHHISNANTSSNNPGRDSIMAYAGLSFPF